MYNRPMGEDISRKILYLGTDLNYWRELQGKFRDLYSDYSFQFSEYFEKNPKLIKNLICSIVNDKVDVIFIDFSVHAEEMLRLMLHLQNEISTEKVAIISLLDQLHSKELLRKSLALGIRINIFKGIELSSAVHHAFAMAFPAEARSLDFAVAKVQFDAIAMSLFNVGYVTENYIHIETNFIFEEGKIIELNTSIFEKVSLTGFFKVIKRGTSNLYSQFSIWYDLEYVHYDENKRKFLEDNVEDAVKMMAEKNDKHMQYDVDEAKKKLEDFVEEEKNRQVQRIRGIKKWIGKNLVKSRPKRTRLLVIDRKLSFVSESREDLESYAFSIRCFTGVDNDSRIIEQTFPGIIVWSMEYPDVTDDSEKEEKKEEKEKEKEEEEKKIVSGEYNDIQALENVIQKIKTYDDYHPFILVFNCMENEDELKKELSYDWLLASSEGADLEIIKSLADSYEKKHAREMTHKSGDNSGNDEKRYYLSKYDSKSIAEFKIPVNVESLSETDITFESTEMIPMFTTFYIKVPVKMTLTVVPDKKEGGDTGGEQKFHALVHGLDEIGNIHLRKYIHKLFFSDLNLKRSDEKEKFEELNREIAEKIRKEKGTK